MPDYPMDWGRKNIESCQLFGELNKVCLCQQFKIKTDRGKHCDEKQLGLVLNYLGDCN